MAAWVFASRYLLKELCSVIPEMMNLYLATIHMYYMSFRTTAMMILIFRKMKEI